MDKNQPPTRSEYTLTRTKPALPRSLIQKNIILRSLVLVEKLSVEQREEDVGPHEEEELTVDELVEGALPLE